MTESWNSRVAQVWASAAQNRTMNTVQLIDALVAERPENDAAAVFEAASVRDFVGKEAEAEPLYRRALELGLPDPLAARAVIQLASTLRNLGRAEEAIRVLQDGFAENPNHELADAARAFLALCLVDTGDARAATAVALDALAGHLPEYSGAVRAYAGDLLLT
ncbi:MAG TPA: tetratricopeptide repeat protein [Glaciihabitans sp.]|nr:tetratricopeptide repeat protein [Glaciihabitans sp.]